jgi:uncharacterized membrane-anchored protein
MHTMELLITMKNNFLVVFLGLCCLASAQTETASQKTNNEKVPVAQEDTTVKTCCVAAVPNRFASKSTVKNPEGMVWIPGGTFVRSAEWLFYGCDRSNQ